MIAKRGRPRLSWANACGIMLAFDTLQNHGFLGSQDWLEGSHGCVAIVRMRWELAERVSRCGEVGGHCVDVL